MTLLRRYGALASIVVAGLALSTALFLLVKEKELLLAKANFEYEAQAQVSSLRRQFLADAAKLAKADVETFSAVVENGLQEFEKGSLEFFFYEQTRSEGDRFLYRHGALNPSMQVPDPDPALSFRVVFEIPGRLVTAVVFPGHKENGSWSGLAWLVFSAGIFLTLVLSTYFYHMTQALGAVTRSHEALKNAQSQLILADRLATLGQISAGVAHEMNNPLGYVSSNLETLEKYVADLLSEDAEKRKAAAADLRPILSESREGMDRLKTIVANLRTFARADASQSVESADIHRVLEGALNIAWNEIKYKAEVVKDYGQIPMLRIHTQQIGQVFINLLVNAAQAIPEKGTISVRTRRDGTQVVIEIEDSGRGFAPGVAKRLFEPFFTTKEPGKGTGLGLSIAKEIVVKHGGSIEADSQPGKGACFRVKLPL